MNYTKISLPFFCCILWISSATLPGTATTADQYPFVVSIQHPHCMAGIPFCGGSILRKAYPAIILTAASCQVHENDFVLLHADTVIGYGGVMSGITKVLDHPNYNYQTGENDIALLWIDLDISAENDFETVTISPLTQASDECCLADQALQALGYGTCHQCPLQFVDVLYVPYSVCNSFYDGGLSEGSMNCASEDACLGESGGPLIKTGTNKQIGIVCSSTDCDHLSPVPGVYTEIGSFYEWIVAEVYESECVNSCARVGDGNYQSCQGCNGYASCSGGIFVEIDCPSPLVWDDIKQMCVYSSNTCGLPLLDRSQWVKPAVGQCVPDCEGVQNGRYQSCEGCNGFVLCCEGMLQEMDCAPSNPPLVWDDNNRRCDWTSVTCP